MKIGIIGAGQIGGTLTRRLRPLGHEVHVANSRDPRTLASLVTETGAVAVEAKDAPRGADLVIVTIPERNVPTLPKGLFAGVPASVAVVERTRAVHHGGWGRHFCRACETVARCKSKHPSLSAR